MSDFYREIETSLTGRRSRGLGLLGWLVIAFFVFTGLLGAAAWAGFLFVKDEVREVIAATRESPAMLAARMLTRLDPELQVLANQAADGGVAIRDLRSGRVASFQLEDLVEGSLRVRTDEGDVRLDLRGNEKGGTLVIDTPEGRTTAELRRDDEGGSLVIDTPEGRTTAELRGDGDGGTLVITAPDGEVTFGAGTEARALPDWLPVEGGMPTEPRQVYSATTGGNLAGAVAWEAERGPEGILESYAARFEDLGFEVVTQSWSERGDQRQGSVWAEDRDGSRTAFVVAAREDGGTSVVLGWGERR